MNNEDTRDKLINATMRLLMDTKNPTKITSRQICAEAQTNLAMINYCFKSKEQLLKIAVEQIIDKDFTHLKDLKQNNLSPKEQLRSLMYDICDRIVDYAPLSKLSIPYILMQDEITIPLEILPFIKQHFHNRKDEIECKIVAYQLISFMQLTFLKEDEFYKYTGINIRDKKQRNKLIDFQINNLLGDE